MKARPILFSTPMVQALLGGRKTQTRRVVNAKWLPLVEEVLRCNGKWIFEAIDYDLTTPYGNIGDLLYVRETFTDEACATSMCYKADFPIVWPGDRTECGDKIIQKATEYKFRPSIYMPRWASRITLESTHIRVERIQDISEEDAIAEGIYMCDSGCFWWDSGTQKSCYYSATSAYAGLWELINGKASWDANPFVWILGFKVYKCNVDKFIQKKAT